MKKKQILLVFVLVAVLLFASCNVEDKLVTTDSDKIIVAVSIVPEAGFVEAIAGDLVEVVTIIPPGNSPANYQPTTKEMQALSDASIYFVMQMPAEEANILPKVSDFNEDLKIVNLRDAVSQVYELRYIDSHSHNEETEQHDEDVETVDPHIWLSPKRAMVMIEKIAEELKILDPDNADVYQKNADEYIIELEALDEYIKSIVGEMDNKAFMIYHGAYGYFADDYGLLMISIEADGKSATASKLQEIIERANKEGITAIFYQDEFDDTQAQTIAQEIGGTVLQAAPLAKDYIKSMTDFADALINNGE